MASEMRQANWIDRLLLLFGRRRAFRVDGESMMPAIRTGDAVLIDPAAAIAQGDVVLARHPYRSSVKILKRVSAVAPDGALTLIGDNPDESTDSRTFGSISIDLIIGKAVCKLK